MAGQPDGVDADAEQSAKDRLFWVDEIKAAKSVFRPYFDQCKKITDRYRDERSGGESTDRKMNIFWSNVQTLQPSIYSQMPKPNYSRDFPDKNPVGRVAAIIAERTTWSEMRRMEWDNALTRVRDDHLLGGRGTAWVCYRPDIAQTSPRVVVKITKQPDGSITAATRDGFQVDQKTVRFENGVPTGEGEPMDMVRAQKIEVDHVLPTDFLHEPVADWAKVDWVARRHLMKRKELVSRFKDKGETVKLTTAIGTQDNKKSSTSQQRKPNAAEVWEIWCKSLKKQIFLCEDFEDGLLGEEDDPLMLERFFPCPKPLYSTMTPDSCIPRPDFCLYQDQADLLDTLTRRIDLVVRAIRVVGVYNAAMSGVTKLVSDAAENELIPIENWVTLANAGGLKGVVDFLPLDGLMAALQVAINARNQMRQDIYEVSGISDIVRGQSNASETATAQQIKGNFATMRLSARQAEMSRFCRDLCRIIGEIQAEHYEAETLKQMSGIQYTDDAQYADDAIALLKNEKLRETQIDMETDATVQPDQKQEQQNRVEFLGAVAPFLEKAAMLGAQAPQFGPLLGQLLLFGIRGFRAGRSIESSLESAIEQLKTQNNAGPAAPPPDPKAEAEAAKLQAEMTQIQQDMQLKQQAAQIEQNLAQGKIALQQLELQIKQAQAAAEATKAASDQQLQAITSQAQTVRAQADTAKAHADIAIAEASQRKSQLDIEGAQQGLAHQRTKAAMEMNRAVFDRDMARKKHKLEVDDKTQQSQDALELEEIDNPPDILPDHVFEKVAKPKEIVPTPTDLALEKLAAALVVLAQPKQVVRGADGRITGVH